MIIADENISTYWISLLRSNGYQVLSIQESHTGITDREVIEVALKHRGILLTEDKDFGELMFAHNATPVSVILLRYDQPQYEQVEEHLLYAVAKYVNQSSHHFITINKDRIRIRNI